MQYSFVSKGKTYAGDAPAIKYFDNTKIELGWEIVNLEGYSFRLEFLQERNGIEICVKKGENYERVLDRYPPSFLDAIAEFPKILEGLTAAKAAG